MLSLLHISDLHYSTKNDNQTNYLRRSFFTDLSKTISRFGRPEGIIFSGDLAHDPDEADVYVSLIDDFITPLSQATGVSPREMAFTPGNHDVSFAALKRLALTRTGLMQNAHHASIVSTFYEQDKIAEYAREISKGFFQFCDYLDNPWDDPFFKAYQVADHQIVSLNGAVSCSELGSKEDRGKRVFPLAAWERAHAALGSKNLLGVVTHFPLDEFNEAHSLELSSKIRDAAQLLFFGHLHNPLPMAVATAGGKLFQLQSGALYVRKDRPKGYAFAQIEGEHIQGMYRTYFETRNEYDEGVNVAAGGRFFSSSEAETFWKSQKPTFTREQLEVHLRTSIKTETDRSAVPTLSGDKLATVYVPPNVWRKPARTN